MLFFLSNTFPYQKKLHALMALHYCHYYQLPAPVWVVQLMMVYETYRFFHFLKTLIVKIDVTALRRKAFVQDIDFHFIVVSSERTYTFRVLMLPVTSVMAG